MKWLMNRPVICRHFAFHSTQTHSHANHFSWLIFSHLSRAHLRSLARYQYCLRWRIGLSPRANQYLVCCWRNMCNVVVIATLWRHLQRCSHFQAHAHRLHTPVNIYAINKGTFFRSLSLSDLGFALFSDPFERLPALTHTTRCEHIYQTQINAMHFISCMINYYCMNRSHVRTDAECGAA